MNNAVLTSRSISLSFFGTDTVTVSASAVQLGTAKKMAVRAKTTADTTDDLYEKWFDKVYIPDQEVAA